MKARDRVFRKIFLLSVVFFCLGFRGDTVYFYIPSESLKLGYSAGFFASGQPLSLMNEYPVSGSHSPQDQFLRKVRTGVTEKEKSSASFSSDVYQTSKVANEKAEEKTVEFDSKGWSDCLTRMGPVYWAWARSKNNSVETDSKKREALKARLASVRANHNGWHPEGVFCGKFLGRFAFIPKSLNEEIKFLLTMIKIEKDSKKTITLLEAARIGHDERLSTQGLEFWDKIFAQLLVELYFGNDFDSLEKVAARALDSETPQEQKGKVKILPQKKEVLAKAIQDQIDFGRKFVLAKENPVDDESTKLKEIRLKIKGGK